LKPQVANETRAILNVAPSRACGLKLADSIVDVANAIVAPSRACGLKLDAFADLTQVSQVAPSRACGLKHAANFGDEVARIGRALTGVWIETTQRTNTRRSSARRALTGVWIETSTAKSR